MTRPRATPTSCRSPRLWALAHLTPLPPSTAPIIHCISGTDGPAHWRIRRKRKNVYYAENFPKVFGTPPTRDAIAKALACYERTVLAANSFHDRADLARLDRAQEEGKPANAPFVPKDYEVVVKRAMDAAKK